MAESTTVARAELVHRFRAMAGRVTVRIVDPEPHADAAVEAVERWFGDVERSCTRFDPDSPLMRANAAGTRLHPVGDTCFRALTEAYEAYRTTDGLFDPRTLESLTALGYDRSLDFAAGDVRTEPAAAGEPAGSGGGRVRPWRPRFDAATQAVRMGRRPVDLGGIGKGWAVREGLRLLRGTATGTAPAGAGALVEAGGDLATFGTGPEGQEWRAAVEDPFGGADPVAVLDVSDAAVATSSVRLRSWTANGRAVHHLIDPRTGRPAQSRLRSVTVLGPDPATAEVWSKALYVTGRSGIRSAAMTHGLSALWVDDAGLVGWTDALRPRLLWRVTRVR